MTIDQQIDVSLSSTSLGAHMTHSNNMSSNSGLFTATPQRLVRFALPAVLLLMGASATMNKAFADELKIIELFTSHGCSSCPSADRLLGELLENDPELMALEFHVDYWNSLIHGNAGNFVDPFSKSDYSMRQREYNVANLAGRPGVYTPQAVVNGRVAAVGSNRRHINKALSLSTPQMVDIEISSGDNPETYAVLVRNLPSVNEDLNGIDIRLARYIDKATTNITGGENKDLVLTNHHVVTDVRRLGAISKDASEQRFTIAAPAADAGCVVLVQEDALTPVYAAAECVSSWVSSWANIIVSRHEMCLAVFVQCCLNVKSV